MKSKRVMTAERASNISNCFTSKINSISESHYDDFIFNDEMKKRLIKIEWFDNHLTISLNFEIPNDIRIDIERYFDECCEF